ncbi:MAG: tRNA (N6-threonylcarbamoyladenosine(37)-N6)-methyltransferase TrmO [Candidatus Krumholzibacteriia bacterium]
MTCTPIGVIRSPFTAPEGMPIQPTGKRAAPGRVEIDPAYREGLADLDGFSHVILLYRFHAGLGYDLKVVPFLDEQARGVFATRAPRRPNAIGLSVVELERIEDGVLHVRNLDVLDGTPLLDLKPYVPQFDAPAGPVRTGWIAAAGRDVGAQAADDRFA